MACQAHVSMRVITSEGGGALFERIDLVDQLRFRLAKALLPERGWIGHMPLLANRLYVEGMVRMRMLPYRGEPSQFVQGLWSAGNSAHRARMSELGHLCAFSAPLNRVWNAAMNRHSPLNVGNAAVGRPSHGGRRTSILCQQSTFRPSATQIDSAGPCR